MSKLTEGAVQSIMIGDHIPEPVLQILAAKKITTCKEHIRRYRLWLSDGKYKVSLVTYMVRLFSEISIHALEVHSIIKLKRYLTNVAKADTHKAGRVLIILELELVAEGWIVGRALGNAVPLIGISHSYDVSENAQLVRIGRFLLQTRTITPISTLHPFRDDWLIRAKVVNKTSMNDWSRAKGERILCIIELADQSGKIRCVASGNLVDTFLGLVEVDKVYYVSRGLVRPICRELCSLNKKYEIILTSETQFEEAQDDGDNTTKFYQSRISKSMTAMHENQSKMKTQIKWMTFKDVHGLEKNHLENGVLFQTFGTILQVRVEKKIVENGHKCVKCHEDIQNFQIKMNICDLSCTQWVTGFPFEVEKILGKSVYEIGQTMNSESAEVLLEDARFRQFTFTCMAKLEEQNGEDKLRFVMLNVQEPQFEEHMNYLLKKINNINKLM